MVQLLCVKGARVLICQLDLAFLVVKWIIRGMKKPARLYSDVALPDDFVGIMTYAQTDRSFSAMNFKSLRMMVSRAFSALSVRNTKIPLPRRRKLYK